MTDQSANPWRELTVAARERLDQHIRVETPSQPGLREFQRDIVLHLLSQLATSPGAIVAERTGRGKSQIAMALMAVLAGAKAHAGRGPLNVGLLAPNATVLHNWMSPERGLIHRAFSSNPKEPTYLWSSPEHALSHSAWSRGAEVHRAEAQLALQIFATHYTRGITNGFGEWGSPEGNPTKKRRDHANAFLGRTRIESIDLLIIDEAHQLRGSHNTRARAIEALFGKPGAPLPVQRVLMLTATPFQLHAAPELARLTRILRYPAQHGGIDFPTELLAQLSPTAIQRRFDQYEGALKNWLRERLTQREAHDAFTRVREAKALIEALLKPIIVRADDPKRRDWLHTRYGKPSISEGTAFPDPSRGLMLDEPTERLLFLAWDGSIASRTTFVATEQQTLTSSAKALRNRQERVGSSAAERVRTPLAPQRVQAALAKLAVGLTPGVDLDHVKVRATADAVVARLSGPTPKPVLVFVERTATLDELSAQIEAKLDGRGQVKVIDGGTDQNQRDEHVRGFQTNLVHALLVSKVAEMGLDIDGPEDKDDIWLIHHDFPWNPAMVEQRNGRVARPAKGAQSNVWIFYPFIRDTVDERIFKRMLMRQALAEVLLGTDDIARALRIADHDTLAGLDTSLLDPELLREVTPNLAPGRSRSAPAPAPAPPPAPPRIDIAADSNTARPPWCALELCELVQASGPVVDAHLDQRLARIAPDLPIWSEMGACYIKVDLLGRSQTVALFRMMNRVVSLSLADARFAPEKGIDVLRWNAVPGVAGLATLPGRDGALALVARAANLASSMSDGELRRLLLETARRADAWERTSYEEDRW
ncbi:hypothetical protein DB30_05664 [Enhygromyxa salina]|uniref:Helicase C-terminal domain-containing protein n=1 Tax=Enhygromyxa salina TaxID=215803 RepID=A0A0C2D5K8_9BACT|nr:helicase-related protein [Enhygromyxa salina]KIG15332.1 hypothetical protein DB30_05664 [Enhygromyxa salina]